MAIIYIYIYVCIYVCLERSEPEQPKQNKSELQRVRIERQNNSLNEPLVGRNGMDDDDDHRHTMDGGGIEYCQC